MRLTTAEKKKGIHSFEEEVSGGQLRTFSEWDEQRPGFMEIDLFIQVLYRRSDIS